MHPYILRLIEAVNNQEDVAKTTVAIHEAMLDINVLPSEPYKLVIRWINYTYQTEFSDFDKYMLKLDPVSGYMSSNFGKEFGEKYNMIFGDLNISREDILYLTKKHGFKMEVIIMKSINKVIYNIKAERKQRL